MKILKSTQNEPLFSRMGRRHYQAIHLTPRPIKWQYFKQLSDVCLQGNLYLLTRKSFQKCEFHVNMKCDNLLTLPHLLLTVFTITLNIASFGPFTGVILDMGDYTVKGVM